MYFNFLSTNFPGYVAAKHCQCFPKVCHAITVRRCLVWQIMNTFLCLVFWYLNNDLCRSCCSLDFWCVELSVRGSVDKIDWRGVWEGEGRMTTHENRPSIRCWHTCGRSSSLPQNTRTLPTVSSSYTLSSSLSIRSSLPLSYLLSWRRR